MGYGYGCEAKAMWFTPEVRQILAYNQPVDLRKSINGLVGLVKSVLAEDPLSGSLFVFVNRRGNYLKLVSWDRTGWCLFAKRLEHGQFHFPSAEAKQELRRFPEKVIPLYSAGHNAYTRKRENEVESPREEASRRDRGDASALA